MRYLGKKSASSFIQRLLDFVWYLAAGVCILLIGIIIFVWTKMPEIVSAQGNLVIETPGLDFIFHEGLQGVPPAHFLLQFLLILPMLAVALVVIHNLRRVFSSLVEETPFLADNVRRVRIIGAAVIAGTVFNGILHTIIGAYLSNAIQLPGLELQANVSLNFTSIFLGAVILILAEVFRLGAEMQEEQDLTV